MPNIKNKELNNFQYLHNSKNSRKNT